MASNQLKFSYNQEVEQYQINLDVDLQPPQQYENKNKSEKY